MVVRRVMLQVLMWATMIHGIAGASPTATTHGRQAEVQLTSMAQIPAGLYRPFFKSASGSGRRARNNAAPVIVPAFELDRAPVTNEAYVGFVSKHPEWRKSRVKALFAEPTYLADWHDDLDPGAERLKEPVTRVSWFAARAFCAARGARLPTVVEWERVAGVSAIEEPGHQSALDTSMPFRFAMGRVGTGLEQQGLVFPGVWEWNADFNSAAGAGGGSRASSSLFCGDGYRATNARDYAAFLRHSLRSSLRANFALKNLGFRCAKGE